MACSNQVYSFPSGTTGTPPVPVNGYPNYGCVSTRPGPAWYYMQIGIAGSIIISISQANTSGVGIDVDFICWGPFPSLTDGCETGLTGTCGPSTGTACCDNNTTGCRNFYPRGNIVDCSYSPLATETCTIPNGQVGEIYILLLTNFSHQEGTITFSQTGGTGQTNCNLVYHCSMIVMTKNVSACDEATNTFSVSGNVEFTNAPPAGTLIVKDNTTIPPKTVTLLPPFISPMAYNISGIPCDGLVHTLTSSFSDSTDCNISQSFTSPGPACPQAHISGGGSLCVNGSGTVPVYVNLAGAGPFTFTYAIDGIAQSAISNYSGASPYLINAGIPGTYTMLSVSNTNCTGPGTVSGTATVTINPLPQPTVSGPSSACADTGGQVYVTEAGKTAYLWYVSSGGTISAGGNGFDHATVRWNSPGNQYIGVNYKDENGCRADTATLLPVTVYPLLPVNVTVTASANPVCSGIPVTFWATGTNGGGNPGYQWRVNAGNVNNGGNAGNAVYSYVPALGDEVSCVLTSNAVCARNNPDTSEVVTMNVIPSLPAGVTISASANPFCAGSLVIFTAVADNGGTGAGYQWNVNAGNVSNGSIVKNVNNEGNAGNSDNVNSEVYSYVPQNGDSVWCVMTSNQSCVRGSPVSSAKIVMIAKPVPSVSFTACFDTIITTTAKPVVLSGAHPLGGVYSGPGVNSSTGIFNPSAAGAGTKTITYSYTNAEICSSSAHCSLHVVTPPSFSCGNLLTDIRAGKTYPTVQIGAHCWMASNLEYGTTIDGSKPQTDNCIAEGYVQGSMSNVQSSKFYQWDELMQYQPAEGAKGLCPPSWHVPTSAEWDDLLSNSFGAGLAAGPLSDSLLVHGFHSLQQGIFYLNNVWAFTSEISAGTMFWTSTLAGEKAIARGLNNINPSVSLYNSSRANAFNARCIKDP